MNNRQIGFGFLCVFLFPLLGYGQQYNFQTYSVNKGLPHQQVHDIVQTQDGYIWMATYGGGLARFDGASFKNFTQDDGLKTNLVEQLFVDSDDNLWISADGGGIAKFEGDSLVYPIENDSLDSYAVTAIEELNDGSMWFGTHEGGIFVYKDQEIDRLTTEHGMSSNTTWEFYQRNNGEVLVATDNGMSVYDGGEFRRYDQEDGLSGNIIYDFVEVDSTEIWVATNRGITAWNGDQFEVVKSENGPSQNDYIYDILKDANDDIWVATRDNGVFIFEGDTVRQLTKRNGLSSNYIYSLFKDSDNNIWVATDEHGVNLYRESGFMFHDEQTGLPNNEILSLHYDADSSLWMGTAEGLKSFDGKEFENYKMPESYHNDYIWNIIGLPNSNKLVAMPDSTLKEFDGNRFKDFSSEYGLKKLFIYDLFIDDANTLWISADNGLYSVDLATHEVEHFSEENGLANRRVFNVFEDRQARKWIGTYYGLTVLDDGDFTSFNIEDGLAHSQINHITQDSRGNIWLGTRGGVSVLKDIKENTPGKIENFGREDGMVLLNTHFLWFDQQGFLWQGTNGGLQRLDVPYYYETDSLRITHYPLVDDGIGMEFNLQSLAVAGKNHAWMGGMEGLVLANPDNLKEIKITNLNITDIQANSSAVNWSAYSDDLSYHNGLLDFPSITFPADRDIIKFTFDGISFTTPDNISYRYKLDGFNEEWLPETEDKSAVFTNLDPGDYTFIVQARNSQSQWQDREARYSFSIATPFWQTYWFFSGIILLLGGMMYGFIRFRVNKLEKDQLQEKVDKQTEYLTKALEEKEILIKEIHHRVKNNLAVISGLLELQIGYANNPFVDRVLAESQRRVQSISMIHEKLYQNERLAEIDFEKYVRELVDIIAYSFNQAEKDIEVTIEVEDFKLGIDQGIPCGLILNELISNAFEHAFKEQKTGSIEIIIEHNQSTDMVEMIVRDDGTGIPSDLDIKQKDTLGITLIKTLVKQIEGELEIESSEGNGTRVWISFQKTPSPQQIPVDEK